DADLLRTGADGGGGLAAAARARRRGRLVGSRCAAMTAAAQPSKQRWKRMQRGMTPWWLLSAPLVILGVLFVAPLLTLFLIGFQHNSLLQVGGWTLDNFRTI